MPLKKPKLENYREVGLTFLNDFFRERKGNFSFKLCDDDLEFIRCTRENQAEIDGMVAQERACALMGEISS